MPTATQINALKTEAAAAGDHAMVAICDAALTGDADAMDECADVLADAMANELSDIDEDEWERVCGDQDRATFARLAIDNGEDIATAWDAAVSHAASL